MKIALSFSGCHRRGGVERVTFECANFLASRGHDVIVLADEWEYSNSPNLSYRTVGSRSWPRFLHPRSFFNRCSGILRMEEFDVLSTHGCICPTDGVHWVQSVHAAWLDRAKQMRGTMSLARWKQRLNPAHVVIGQLEAHHFRRKAYRKLIATTPEVRRDLHEYYGVPEQDVVIIPNGFNPREFNPVRRAECRADVRRRLGLSDEHVVFLLVANELDRKGYPTLLSAMRRLDASNVRLIVVGRPPVAAVKRLAAAAGLADQVLALGSCSDVASMHAAADLFVLPTQYEAFALAILESLGSGLPVITTNVPGARDAIRPGVNGYVISDPRGSDELAEILRPLLDPGRRESLVATTAATADPYKWPNVLLRYEQVLLDNSQNQSEPTVPVAGDFLKQSPSRA